MYIYILNTPVLYCAQKICVNFSNEYFRHTHLFGCDFLFWKGAGTMETDNKMGQEPINKLILQMSMPPLFSMFLQYSYNLVDSMFVAKINER